jgi:outer membrane biosynthesis protein TonB
MSSNPSPTRNRAAALRRPQPTTAQGHPYGVVISTLLHGAIFAALLLHFHPDFTTPEESHAVPVDLVTIADKTNVTAQAPPTPPQPEKLDIPIPPAEPPPTPQMQDVEPAPVPPVPKFEVQKEKPPPVEKPVEKPAQKNNAADFNALLNKLTTPDKPVKNAKAGPRVIQGVGAGNAMTASIVDALRSQIRPCWSLQSYPPNPADLVVDFDLSLKPDGSIAQLHSDAKTSGNPYTRASAEAAERAIVSCAPYKLPADSYNTWREISPLRFDPRQMMEQ